ncbi:MAG: GGDEF domain-containing protein [Deltaproteobacteria bacterium]|nr:GGDEF domain-containing protein [Deltaproteobacteria bacterium]
MAGRPQFLATPDDMLFETRRTNMSASQFSPPAGTKRATTIGAERATPLGAHEMALDTLAAMLRILGEFALDQEEVEAALFTQLSEQWAQHVLVAAPVPGTDGPPADARRDWAGVREFTREYCRNSSVHTRTVIGDLRQVVWVFIQNLNQTLAQSSETDGRILEQMGRLETLAQSSSTSDLKREVLATVVTVARVMEERKKNDHDRVEDLGARVRLLGEELESARKESEVDPLTRLFNRKAFDAFLSRTVELSHAFEQPACLMLVDLDRFKPINDTFGHQTGDSVLSKLADVLSRIFLRKNDLVARYGGDELAVVLRETSVRDAQTLADRLLRAVRAVRIEREGTSFGLTVSIGIAELLPADNGTTWLARTDRALYQAKNAGRDRVVTATD